MSLCACIIWRRAAPTPEMNYVTSRVLRHPPHAFRTECRVAQLFRTGQWVLLGLVDTVAPPEGSEDATAAPI